MSDARTVSSDAHLAAMKVILLLIIFTVCDTHGQAQLDDYARDDVDTNKDDVDITKNDVDTPDVASAARSVESSDSRSVKKHHHHHSKRHKYWKATVEFLKKTLNPNTLMQNAWFTEMLRKFSHSEDPPEEEVESEESEEVHTAPPTKRRRGRPKKALRPASHELPGLRGIFKKGLKKISTIDKKKIRRKIKMMKRMARKAKKPLKSVVKFYLSSKNANNNGFGNNNYGNNNY